MTLIHPRTLLVQKAHCEIEETFLKIAERDNLTAWEMMGILLEIATSVKKFALREERRPDDPEQPGDRL